MKKRQKNSLELDPANESVVLRPRPAHLKHQLGGWSHSHSTPRLNMRLSSDEGVATSKFLDLEPKKEAGDAFPPPPLGEKIRTPSTHVPRMFNHSHFWEGHFKSRSLLESHRGSVSLSHADLSHAFSNWGDEHRSKSIEEGGGGEAEGQLRKRGRGYQSFLNLPHLQCPSRPKSGDWGDKMTK